MILRGDCLHTLKTLESNSVDSVVTDPPYGLSAAKNSGKKSTGGFMGKKWDYEVPSVEIWREVLRVLKPGGHVLSFCGTRTYHRMVVNMEDAGLEIRDQLQWIYASGFPKSHDVSKAIDKAAGAERGTLYVPHNNNKILGEGKGKAAGVDRTPGANLSEPAVTDAAKQWQGWGTALKPANEPICLARKPIEGTVAQNVLKYGCGGLNIDESRIEAADQDKLAKNWDRTQSTTMEGDRPAYGKFGAIDLSDRAPTGRFPANVLFDESAAEMLDEQSIAGGIHSAGKGRKPEFKPQDKANIFGTIGALGGTSARFDDEAGKIGASRFFYCAKASKAERNAGLEGMPQKKFEAVIGSTKNQMKRMQDGVVTGERNNSPQANHHPTVKPLKLMQYLIKLVTPPGGTVLDPFMGSGTTGVAAKSLGFNFIGCELSNEYAEIAERRIEAAE